MKYIGVDPGKQGGLALINGGLVKYVPMPENLKDIHSFFNSAAKEGTPITAVIEKVGPMPKQGVTSMFSFGAGYGALQMAAIANKCRVILVTPQKWKKEVLAGTDKSKDSAIRVCEFLFPEVNLVRQGCRKPHDGMAEAILLAEYGRRLNL